MAPGGRRPRRPASPLPRRPAACHEVTDSDVKVPGTVRVARPGRPGPGPSDSTDSEPGPVCRRLVMAAAILIIRLGFGVCGGPGRPGRTPHWHRAAVRAATSIQCEPRPPAAAAHSLSGRASTVNLTVAAPAAQAAAADRASDGGPWSPRPGAGRGHRRPGHDSESAYVLPG
jgi:hypothetical protein